MAFESPAETPSDRIRRMIEEQNIKVGRKESEEDSYATLVTLRATSFNRPEGLRGRILEVNYDDAEPYLVLTVHGYKAQEKVLLKDVTSMDIFRQ